MKTYILTFVTLLMFLPFKAFGVTPVQVDGISIDTTLYDTFRNSSYVYVPGPFTEWNSTGGKYFAQMIVGAFQKKNSNQFDFYSFSGKIGTSVIPIMQDSGKSVGGLIFSCTMVDDDDGWEAIVHYTKDNTTFFKVFDDDGTELLAGTTSGNGAFYGFDGNSTYVLVRRAGYMNYDCWRFRTNISANSPKLLSKTKSLQSPAMQIYGLSGGDYNVSLIPSSGNQVQFQMFDLMGRCVFSKQLENLKSPVTFTIPESNVPNSPFIAKVKDGNETVYKKQVPVK